MRIFLERVMLTLVNMFRKPTRPPSGPPHPNPASTKAELTLSNAPQSPRSQSCSSRAWAWTPW